jgi:uncharacterized repeat protein (TIGR01451 family)
MGITSVAVGLIALPLAVSAGHGARPVTAVPGLTISVSDGQTTASTGEKLTYLVSIRDAGAAAVPHLKITQTMPPGVTFLSASRHGVATGGMVAWYATIPAGGTETFSVTARVTQTPARELRLAAVACATPQGSTRPLICAAHLDRLPAAAAAAAGAGSSAPQAAGPSETRLAAYAGAGLGLVVLIVGGLTVAAARRRRQSQAG